MDNSDDRVSELVAAAVAGELSPEEAAELDALRRTHPWIDAEIESLRGVALRLEGSTVTWSEVTPGGDLRDRIVADMAAEESTATAESSATEGSSAPPVARRPSRLLVTVLGVAACVGVGLGAGLIVPAAISAPPSGPPGTLGAVEHVDMRGEADGADIDADLVAHTWGTEAVVDAEGLDVGATYSIVFIGTDGSEFSAGAMLGSSVSIHCRVNAAVMREDVARFEIRDEDGAAVAEAEVPAV